MRQLRQLDEGWVLLLGDDARARLGTDLVQVPATVPGCVHTDLMAAGLLADPTVGLDEADQHWIGETDWTYRLDLDEPPSAPDEQLDLVCDGLDTLASLTWNGELVGTTANQHRRHRFSLAGAVTAGTDRLEITFAAPTTAAEARRAAWGERPNPYGRPYNFLRKMACNFGWDWGPRLTTSGIWRPIRLERWDRARIAAVRPTASVEEGCPVPGETGRLSVVVELDHAPDAATRAAGGVELDLIVRASDGVTAARLTRAVDGGGPGGGPVAVTLDLEVPAIERWWPIGVGAQPCYTIDCALFQDEQLLDLATTRVGFRSVEIDTTPDADGNGARFAVVVNGQRIWIRGFNWIPDDCFPAAVTPERTRSRIDEAAAANANLLRVWGGGTYADDAFYRHCDDIGILVWQDFAFACAAYPEVELRDEIVAEAADNVDRLMSHPSLVVWNGNNECLEGWADWGWREELGGRRWGETIYRSWLPEVVARLDPGRPYLDGSPTSLDPALHPQDPAHGTVHVWDVWNRRHLHHYRDHEPRFVSELGFQAPATHATLRRAVGADIPLIDTSPGVAHRQRAEDGAAKLARWTTESFGPVDDPDDWLYLTQLNQARAVEVGVGHFRSLHRRCSGVIWWQLNDCWPAISWSVLDADGRRKPSWYAARRAMADRAVVLRPHPEGVEVVAVNDSQVMWTPTLSVAGLDGDGAEPVTDLVGPLKVEAGTAQSLVVGDPAGAGVEPDRSLVVATAVGGRAAGGSGALRAVLAGPAAPCPEPVFSTSVNPFRGGVAVEVTATTVVRDLCLFPDRVDPAAVVDDMVVTLLPGEERTFEVATATDVSLWADALGRPAPVVLRALGDRPRSRS